MVPRVTVWLCPGGSKNKGGIYWGEEEGTDVPQPVSCHKNKGPSLFCLVYRFGNHFSLSGDHTETMEVVFDPKVTSYSALLKMFWENHNPTSCVSRQYMSAIFYHSDKQKELAEESRDARQEQLAKKIVTKITKAETFYNAEE